MTGPDEGRFRTDRFQKKQLAETDIRQMDPIQPSAAMQANDRFKCNSAACSLTSPGNLRSACFLALELAEQSAEENAMTQESPTSSAHHNVDGCLRPTEPWISEFERIFVAAATGIRGEEMAALRRVYYKRSRRAPS